ncbi:sugar ABC transporter substrate-binding protein [Sporanaerobium hydrogeniformans]|uniref:Sugar ABC transporter substrate-binding protein n=1 Tax=Sporanaerobium hydrogeniformans TaxID=3072179 RepID=A0AC61DFD7_9FIRM|nr:ABC transporter substrate-binding protein [Sporanaerobium hydrogeniformans]PHV71441.1 sugar ABC transporter substrate-binding protein [Sporanaerobium hydrogeniformans]
MKLMKKGLVAGLTTICAMSMLLAGCGAKKEEAAPTPSADTKSEAPASEAPATDAAGVDTSKKVELTWYFIGNGPQEDVGKVEEAVNKYLADNTKLNATIKLNCFDWGSYPDKLQAMIASGEKFDICFTANWANDYFQQSAKGAFLPLNDLLPKYAPKTQELLGADFLAGSQIDGINYAIPANKEKAHQWGLVIRKDIAEKYNMDFSNVKTLADMEPFFQTIKEKEPNMYAFESCIGESAFRTLDFDFIGAEKTIGVLKNDSTDMKVFNQFEAPETKEFFKLMHKFYKAGYIREDAASVNDYSADQKAGKIFAAVRSLKPGKDAEESNAMGQQYMQLELTPPVMSNRETTGSMQAISRTSENPERALMFLELFNTDPALNNLINYGIEGIHYEKVSDNVIKALPDSAKYGSGLGWMYGNQFINYLMDNEDPQKWAKFEAFNAAATPTKTLGFVFNPDKVKTEIAQCASIWDQYVAPLETGTADPEVELPKAIEAFKAAGSDAIMAEKQAQLDAWLAAK